VHAALVEAGLAASGAQTVRDVTSCPGARSCAMSVTQSRGLARLLTDSLDARPDLVAQAKDLTIKISGCPNSCGQHHISGLGFQGGMRKVGGKAVAQYLVHVGGGIDANGARFGRLVTKIPVRRLPQAVERLIGLYTSDKKDGEKPDDFFGRVATDRVRQTLSGLEEMSAADATADDFFDLDEHNENIELNMNRKSAEEAMC
jgi:sulfite reductase (ferredoxin)